MKNLLDQANELTNYIRFCNDTISRHPSDDEISRMAIAARTEAIKTRRQIVIALLIAKQ